MTTLFKAAISVVIKASSGQQSSQPDGTSIHGTSCSTTLTSIPYLKHLRHTTSGISRGCGHFPVHSPLSFAMLIYLCRRPSDNGCTCDPQSPNASATAAIVTPMATANFCPSMREICGQWSMSATTDWTNCRGFNAGGIQEQEAGS